MTVVTARGVFLWTLIAATAVAIIVSTADVPRPDWYDVEVDRDVASAALNNEIANTEVARTPGAVLLSLPSLLTSKPYVLSVVLNVICLALISVAIFRLVQPSRWGTILLIVALPASIAFKQAVFHGSTFLPVAAAILWGWLFLNDRPELAGILLGIAVVARLWPLLLIFVIRDRKAVGWMIGTTGTLTAVGLLLPGVTFESTIRSIVGGGSTWVSASHNGSVAGWLSNLGNTPAIVIGGLTVLVIWLLGLTRLETRDERIGWTLPASILASPLAWLPYLLVVVPSLFRNKPILIAATVIVTVAYPLVPHQITTSLIALLGMLAVAVSSFGARPVGSLDEKKKRRRLVPGSLGASLD